MFPHRRKDFQCRVRVQESLQGLGTYPANVPRLPSVPAVKGCTNPTIQQGCRNLGSWFSRKRTFWSVECGTRSVEWEAASQRMGNCGVPTRCFFCSARRSAISHKSLPTSQATRQISKSSKRNSLISQSGSGFRVPCSGFRVPCSGFRVSSFKLPAPSPKLHAPCPMPPCEAKPIPLLGEAAIPFSCRTRSWCRSRRSRGSGRPWAHGLFSC